MPKRNRNKELKRSGAVRGRAGAVEAGTGRQALRRECPGAGGLRAQGAGRRHRGRCVGPTATTSVKEAKAAAVAELKAARSRRRRAHRRGRGRGIRSALGELREFETGERPAWAPCPRKRHRSRRHRGRRARHPDGNRLTTPRPVAEPNRPWPAAAPRAKRAPAGPGPEPSRRPGPHEQARTAPLAS